MDKIFFELEPVQNSAQNCFRARLQISDAFKANVTNENLTEKVAIIEKYYMRTISRCRAIYRQIRTCKRGDRLYRYWDIANAITGFLKRMDKKGYFLNYPDQHFARDLVVTSRTIHYLLTFRQLVTDKKHLDPTKSWSYYTRRNYRMKYLGNYRI